MTVYGWVSVGLQRQRIRNAEKKAAQLLEGKQRPRPPRKQRPKKEKPPPKRLPPPPPLPAPNRVDLSLPPSSSAPPDSLALLVGKCVDEEWVTEMARDLEQRYGQGFPLSKRVITTLRFASQLIVDADLVRTHPELIQVLKTHARLAEGAITMLRKAQEMAAADAEKNRDLLVVPHEPQSSPQEQAPEPGPDDWMK